MEENNKYSYIPLTEPIPITEQVWPEGTLPLVHTRTMTYMHENYITDCIEGILMQKTTFPVLVLIHDDASTDKTVEIVREYEQKYPRLIKAYYQKENSFRRSDKSERRAEFMSWRIGKYEAMCEGDDYWIDSLKLQKQAEILEGNDRYSIVGHNYQILKDNLFEVVNPTLKSEFNIYDLAQNMHVQTASIMFRTQYLSFISYPYPDDGLMRTSHHLFLSITKFGLMYYLNDVMTVYRVHGKGMASGETREEKCVRHMKHYRALLKDFADDRKLCKIIYYKLADSVTQYLLIKKHKIRISYIQELSSGDVNGFYKAFCLLKTFAFNLRQSMYLAYKAFWENLSKQ